MRKRTLGLAGVVLLSAVLLFNGISRQRAKERQEEPDFKFYSSISNTSGTVRRTQLVVIAEYDDPEEILAQAEQRFNQMNGIPNQLTIYLYRRKEDVQTGEHAVIREYYYE